MKTRLMRYSLAAGLVVLLALPAAAYSQLGPRGPRSAGGEQIGRGRGSGATFARRGSFGARLGGAGRQASLAARALAHAEQIGLADEQREQISAAQRGYRETSINHRADTQIAALELRDLMQTGTPDIGAVEAKLRELSEYGIAQRTGALRLDAAVGEILTAEQVDQLAELRRNRRNRGDRGDRPGRVNRDGRGNRDDRVSTEGGRGRRSRRGAPIESQDTTNAR